MKKLFGTDGIRGEAGAFPLDEKTIETIGKSLTRQFREKYGRAPRFVIGRDTRESGAWIEQAFCRGASALDAICESAEIITTPGIAFLTKKYEFDAGIVISASHNPFRDNGIKIFSPDGKKIAEATEREIEKDIFESSNSEIQNLDFKPQILKSDSFQALTPQLHERINMLQMTSSEIAELVQEDTVFSLDKNKAAEMQNQYLEYLTDSSETLDLTDLKMVVDCANGAACELAPKLFQKFGAETILINNSPDGTNINENCGSLHLDKLQEKVLEEKADFGVAFDGDADRSLFVDEKGNLVDGDAVLWIMANHLLEKGKLNNKTVVATVMSNIGLEIALNSKGIKLKRTSVGDKYVLHELIETDSAVGGEQSGHIIFPFHSLVGDGMLTTLFLLEAMTEKGKSLSQMTEGFTKFPQILVNINVREKQPFESVTEIAEAASELENKLGEKGRLLLRYSGTENLARVMIEGENQQEIETQANTLAEVIKKCLG